MRYLAGLCTSVLKLSYFLVGVACCNFRNELDTRSNVSLTKFLL